MAKKTTTKKTATRKRTAKPKKPAYDFKPFKESFGLRLDLTGRDAMTTPHIMSLINYFAGKGKTYVEVGTYRGATLRAAAWRNPNTVCYGIDNFSWFTGKNAEEERTARTQELWDEMEKVKNIELKQGDYKAILKELKDEGIKINTYFFDGPHTEDDQYFGLKYLEENDMFGDDPTIIVDDANWKAVEEPTMAFAEEYGWEAIIDIRTSNCPDPVWWNGIIVLKRKK